MYLMSLTGTEVQVSGGGGFQIRNVAVSKDSNPALGMNSFLLQSLHGCYTAGTTTSFGVHPDILGGSELTIAEPSSIVVELYRVISRVKECHVHHADVSLAGGSSVDERQYVGKVQWQFPVGRRVCSSIKLASSAAKAKFRVW